MSCRVLLRSSAKDEAQADSYRPRHPHSNGTRSMRAPYHRYSARSRRLGRVLSELKQDMKNYILITLLFFSACTQKNAISFSSFEGSDTQLAFIPADETLVYKDTSGNKLGILNIGDSILVQCNPTEYCGVFYDGWYRAHVKVNGEEQLVFVKANQLARGDYSDLDGNGKKELLIYGYTAHHQDSFSNPVFVKGIENGKEIYSQQFTAYNDLFIDVLGPKGFPGLSFLRIDYGLEACDYPHSAIFFYFKDGHLHKLLEDDYSFSEYASVSSEYIFPSDSLGEKNRLKVYRSLTYNDEMREPGDTDLFDTIVYEYRNGKFQVAQQTHYIK
jgi:hypothetical protein